MPIPGLQGGFSPTERISADGRAVVGSVYRPAEGGKPNRYEPYRWSESGGFQELGLLPDSYSGNAYGVSADGSVVAGACITSGGHNEAFRWTQETGMQGLGRPPGREMSHARSLSGDGTTIVGHSGDFWRTYAAVWDAQHGWRDVRALLIAAGVNMNGWRLIDVHGVSFDGSVIVGTGENPAGQGEAWMAVIPEPATTAAALLAPAALLRRRRVPPR